jgi:hypothetical protein
VAKQWIQSNIPYFTTNRLFVAHLKSIVEPVGKREAPNNGEEENEAM